MIVIVGGWRMDCVIFLGVEKFLVVGKIGVGVDDWSVWDSGVGDWYFRGNIIWSLMFCNYL